MRKASMMRVLVVDDYGPWQDSICLMIGAVQGVQVVGRAVDGFEAVQKATELQPDLILLDIGLPAQNGLKAALQIRQSAPESQVLFISENRSQEIIDAAMATGAVGYIVKSNAGAELLPAIRALQCCLIRNKLHIQGTGHSIVYEELVDAAVSLMDSDFASVQMLFPERGRRGELRLLAFRGFDPQAARSWEWVHAESKCTCGIALRESRRVVAPDIACDDLVNDSLDRQVYVQAGIGACQTTPLIARSGDLVGMISTHWRAAHQPSDNDFRLFDILAKGAAEVIERCRRDET